jgi:Methyltransferase domain
MSLPANALTGHSLLRRFVKWLLGPRLSNARFLFAAPLAYAPGHFYSPICDPAEVGRRYRDPSTATPPTSLPGIELKRDAQIALWESWAPFLAEARAVAIGEPPRRYRLPSSTYDVGDAIIYGCMLRHLQPARLVEVGSGSSSALALDTFDRFFIERPQTSFIEPYPALLLSFLTQRDKDTVEIIATDVQDVPPSYFEKLQRNDILFIDSTHIVKTGSDVVYELFEVLPRLRPGVVVHFHDVFYPFEYPRDWALVRNYSWNEQYALRAFLVGNRDWEILFFNDYFVRMERSRVERSAPEILRNPGGGLWLRRREESGP